MYSVSALFLAAIAVSQSDEFRAEIGRTAPPVRVAEWIRGEPVDLETCKGRKVVLLQFWATWSPRSRETAPHLSELQQRFAENGLAVVAITDEPAPTARPYVEKFADRFKFSVGCDDKRATTKAYLASVGVKDLPHAFIIDRESRLAWHGGMAEVESVVAAVIDGTYDPQAAQAAERERAEARRKAQEIGARMRAYFIMVSTTRNESDGVQTPEHEVGQSVIELGSRNAMLMNEFAWTILTDDKIKRRDVPLAVRASKAACDATADSDATYLDTHARALFDSSDFAAAVERQKKAVEACSDPKQKQELLQTLRRYQERASGGG